MKSLPGLRHYRVSSSANSIVLLVCSAVWCVGAWMYCSTVALGNDWFATPDLWMMIVMLMPSICFSSILILVDARRHSRFSRLEWWALVAAFVPLTAGTMLAFQAVKVLLSAGSVGI